MLRRKAPVVLSLFAQFAVFAAAAAAAEPGGVKGRFVYGGKDDGGKVAITKDTEYCGKQKIEDEEIELGEKGGLINVFVYLNVKRGDKIAITPEYEQEAAEAKTLDNKGCRFEPHAMTLWNKHKLRITNSDPVGHNTNATLIDDSAASFNQLISNEKPFEATFTKSERFPSKFACNIHPWMTAYVLIRDNPYMAVSTKDGAFEIKHMPAGKHEFVIWHEAKGNVRDLKVGGGKTDRKGIVALEVTAGKTLDLGDIEVAPKLLGK